MRLVSASQDKKRNLMDDIMKIENEINIIEIQLNLDDKRSPTNK